MNDNLSAVQAEGLTVIPDQELVARAQAGDASSFEELVRHHRDKTYRLARYLCNGHAEDAEDTFQNALMKAYRHLAAFRGEAQFSTWLTRIAINECRMHWRQQGRERNWVHLYKHVEGEETSVPLDIADSSGDPGEQYARREFQRILGQCLATLPPSYRLAFVLREINGLSNQEIAVRMGLSVSAAKSRIFRARLLLRHCLRKTFCSAKRCYWPAPALGLRPRTHER